MMKPFAPASPVSHWLGALVKRHGTAGLLAALMLALPAAHPPTPAQAQERDPVCLQLEAELARLQAPQARVSQRTIRQMERARAAAQAAERRARRAGCFQQGFLIFQPQRPRACRRLEADYRRANDAYRQLRAQVGNAGRPRASRAVRDRVIRALAANRCGPQYARYANASRQRGVFSFFLGPQADVIEPLAPRGGGYRTLCVRTCDGYYFPVSFSTFPEFFGKDEAICRRTCPGSEVQLYVYRNPGQQPEDAQTPQGVPLTSLDNAFRYRSEVVEGCTCRAPQIAGADGERVQMAFSPGLIAPDEFEDDDAGVPMPRQRPSIYAVSDIENPSVPGESRPKRDVETVRGPVRIVGPRFYLAQ